MRTGKECHISRLDKKERKKYTVGECMVWIKIWVLAAFHFHIITIKPNFYYTSHKLKNKCTCNTLIFHVIKMLGKPISAFKSPDRTMRAGLIEAAENSIPLPLFEGGMYLFSAEPSGHPFLSFGVLPHFRTIAADPSNWGLINKYFYLCGSEWRPLKGLFILGVE